MKLAPDVSHIRDKLFHLSNSEHARNGFPDTVHCVINPLSFINSGLTDTAQNAFRFIRPCSQLRIVKANAITQSSVIVVHLTSLIAGFKKFTYFVSVGGVIGFDDLLRLAALLVFLLRVIRRENG